MTTNSPVTNVVFFGTPEFSVPTLKALIDEPGLCVKLVVTQPDRPAGRGAKLQVSPIKAIALTHNIPVLQPEHIKKSEKSFLEQLSHHGPLDLAVVVAFGQILPKSVLDTPRLGCINVHASLLPRWRGAAPIQRAIMANDKESGVNLMRMEAGLDSGPVYSQVKVPIGLHTTFGELHDELAATGAKLVSRDIFKIIVGTLKATPQSEVGLTYAHKIRPEEAHIEWTKTAAEIECLIRAMSPRPGAFTLWDGKRLKIFGANPSASFTQPLVTAGQAVIRNGKVIVQCGHGSLELEEIQIEGRKRMSVPDFLRGVELPEQMRFG